MASTVSPILNYNQLKFTEEFLVTDSFSRLLSPRKAGSDIFQWYVGHDPYNSADCEAFMLRIAQRLIP